MDSDTYQERPTFQDNPNYPDYNNFTFDSDRSNESNDFETNTDSSVRIEQITTTPDIGSVKLQNLHKLNELQREDCSQRKVYLQERLTRPSSSRQIELTSEGFEHGERKEKSGSEIELASDLELEDTVEDIDRMYSNESEPESQPTTIFECKSCSKQFKSHKTLMIHQSIRHENNGHDVKRFRNTQTNAITYKCCSKVFLTLKELRFHTSKRKSWPKIIELKSQSIPGKAKKKFICKICKLEYKFAGSLSKHYRKTHMNETQMLVIVCEICGGHFRDQRALSAHRALRH